MDEPERHLVVDIERPRDEGMHGDVHDQHHEGHERPPDERLQVFSPCAGGRTRLQVALGLPLLVRHNGTHSLPIAIPGHHSRRPLPLIIPRPARAAMYEGRCLPKSRAPSLPCTGGPGALGCRAAVRRRSLPDGP